MSPAALAAALLLATPAETGAPMGVPSSGSLAPEVEARATAPLAAVPEGALEWEWLGVGGVRLRTSTATVLFDPYVTRAGLLEVTFGRLSPDEALLERLFPEADLILIGHSHYDHLGDAPALAKRTGALLLGSPTTCFLSRALAAPRCLSPRRWRTEGGVDVTVLEARHGEMPLLDALGGGRSLSRPPKAPVHALLDMPHGGPRAYLVELPLGGGKSARVFLHSTAGLSPPDDDTLRALEADLAFVGVALADGTEGFVERALLAVKPGGTLVLTHFDPFMEPLSDDLPTTEQPTNGRVSAAVPPLDDVIARAKRTRPDVTVVLPRPFARARNP